ncbi:MAG TPA: DUF4202 domain-containing protein [Cycloclasticus sp.]|jgi:hypothetical protein|nr:DUF4202 domain-containing protein [Cycloclasticus sp.]HIL93158.1 DUF4202 domain-containing protein [Cycloclasticus sp.]
MNHRLKQTLQLIDQANAGDPKDGVEALYSQRMLETLHTFNPHASEPLTLACYAQHVCRWKLIRKDYPAGLTGYLTWRTDLAKLHANILAEAMQESSYSEDDIERAGNIIQKKKLKTDPEAQTLEDVSCLVFLNYYLDAFASKHAEEKIIDIVQKTWGKMSDKGHQSALALTLPPHLQNLVGKALA